MSNDQDSVFKFDVEKAVAESVEPKRNENGVIIVECRETECPICGGDCGDC